MIIRLLFFLAVVLSPSVAFAQFGPPIGMPGAGVSPATTILLGGVKCDGVTTACAADGTITATTGGTAGINQLTSDCTAGPGSGSQAITCTKISGKAVTLGGSLTFSGAFGTTITVTNTTAVTLPTSGTLATVSGALGTPTSVTLTNGTGLPISGIAALGTGVGTFLATPSSANLRAALTDETGTGAAYFQGGDLGTPSAGVLTNATGLPLGSVTGLGTGVATFLATPSVANFASALTSPPLTVAIGGTGVTSLTGNAMVLTNAGGTALSTLAPGSNGNCPVSNGTTWTSVACPQSASIFTGNTAGVANTYTIASPLPGGFTLTDQYIVCGTISTTNTGASTLNVNSTGATAIKKQTSAGLAALIGGELVGSNTQYCWQYNASGTAWVLLTNLGSGVTFGATTHTVTQAEWDYGQLFVVNTGSQTLALPVATTLSPNGGIVIITVGQSVSLQPNAADGINGGTVNVAVTIPANLLTVVSTSGSSGSNAFNAPLGPVAGTNVTLTQSSNGTTTINSPNSAQLNVAQSFTAAQRGTPTNITISTATFTPNFDTAQNFEIDLIHASCPCALANPSTTPVTGQSGMIAIKQSSTGSDTIGTWGSQYQYVGGTSAITLSTAASTFDYLPYYIIDATHIVLGSLIKGPAH